MIISRQLQEGQDLARGKETLHIKQLIRTGRSCTAVVTNSKGKEEKLSITDMWNQKITIVGFDKKADKKIPEKAKQPKVAAPVKTKKSAEELIVIVQEVPRAGGIATIVYSNQGPIRSSWKRSAA